MTTRSRPATLTRAMADSLREACAAIAALLPVARALTAEPDADGAGGHGQPGSCPPGNQAAAAASMDAHEGLRRLEASLRLAVTGHPGRRRGGSDANTMAAVKAIEALGHGLPERHEQEYDENGKRRPCHCAHCAATRYLGHLIGQVEQLPAVDTAEPWRRVPGVPCPYCGHAMLRVRPREGTVTCLRYGACADADGRHPVGRLEASPLNGDPLIRWADGLVAP